MITGHNVVWTVISNKNTKQTNGRTMHWLLQTNEMEISEGDNWQAKQIAILDD